MGTFSGILWERAHLSEVYGARTEGIVYAANDDGSTRTTHVIVAYSNTSYTPFFSDTVYYLAVPFEQGEPLWPFGAKASQLAKEENRYLLSSAQMEGLAAFHYDKAQARFGCSLVDSATFKSGSHNPGFHKLDTRPKIVGQYVGFSYVPEPPGRSEGRDYFTEECSSDQMLVLPMTIARPAGDLLKDSIVAVVGMPVALCADIVYVPLMVPLFVYGCWSMAHMSR